MSPPFDMPPDPPAIIRPSPMISTEQYLHLLSVVGEMHDSVREAIVHAKSASDEAAGARAAAITAVEENADTTAKIASVEIKIDKHEIIDDGRFKGLDEWQQEWKVAFPRISHLLENIDKTNKALLFIASAVVLGLIGGGVGLLFDALKLHYHLK